MTAAGGAHAIALCEREGGLLVAALIDKCMPEVDGFSTLAAIRRLAPQDQRQTKQFPFPWYCRGRDSNPHALRHRLLTKSKGSRRRSTEDDERTAGKP
jgi:CheY-like chemotaxis protein